MVIGLRGGASLPETKGKLDPPPLWNGKCACGKLAVRAGADRRPSKLGAYRLDALSREQEIMRAITSHLSKVHSLDESERDDSKFQIVFGHGTLDARFVS